MNKHAGFTLIEILIAMVLLAIGLLGLAVLQATSLKNNHSAYNRSQATQLAYDMADRIRANPADANKLATSAYVATTTPAIQSSCNNSTGCTAALMAQNDRVQWNANIIAALGTLGKGTIAVDAATRIFTITVNWDDNRDGDVDGNGGDVEGDTDGDGDTDDDPFFQMSFQL
jgi:type IV pilus assembly protein PilV